MKFMWQSVKNHHTEKKKTEEIVVLSLLCAFPTGLIFLPVFLQRWKNPSPTIGTMMLHFLQQSLQLLLRAPQPFSQAKMNWKLMCSLGLTASPTTTLSHLYQSMIGTFCFRSWREKKPICSIEWFRKCLIHWYQSLENHRYLQLQHEPLPESKTERKPSLVAVP